MRSLVVRSDYRGRGIAARLVAELEARARKHGFNDVYLLTLDALEYFRQQFGYQEIERETAPNGIRQSSQFSGVCPDSAILMYKTLR